ncbi:NAD(P)H-hydrate dehydratase [Methylobacterium radiodurans]|uniref:ADP-dependent (S)-NAD(P)H-hydrate dehydratase n=1 Tax=Methylobacterium radiodurans TaxID=2202828 RepID=A0A2U8VYD9_9HYPH|nr:NAD(P)H-hydrate dehydratase [Methylobacterium radiodurans]AWN38272.1 NAD(P)H-hydrate dehydratase [Methylobacterium radiodurans]
MDASIPVNPELLRAVGLPEPGGDSKDARGRVLVAAGCLEVPGAILLCAEAALRVGAGKVRIATCRDLALPVGLALPEARVLALPQTPEGRIAPEAAGLVAGQARGCDAFLVGPGMMDDADTSGLVRALLADPPGAALVLDAGAMAALAEDPDLVRCLEPHAVITPHAGEMARLLGRERDAIETDPLGAAREAASRFRTVTVMKGARTHVVLPDGTAYRHEAGHPGLATAGSGDVLAGLIAGLLARGAEPRDAALWGVWLHGAAGRRCARDCGGIGFLARELSPAVPSILAGVLAGTEA